jgi:hypothetical protein
MTPKNVYTAAALAALLMGGALPAAHAVDAERTAPESVTTKAEPTEDPTDDPTDEPTDEPVQFTDVPEGLQFRAEILWLAENGIAKGWTADDGTSTYRPFNSVNRDAMAAFVYRLAGSPEYTAPEESPFEDIHPGDQHYEAVAWLSDQKIANGWTADDGTRTYRPLQPINRDAMAAFLYRLAGSPEFTAPETSPFTDINFGEQHYEEVAWLAHHGISTGWPEDKTFRPLQPVKRDAMAAFLYRFDEKGFTVVDGTDEPTEEPAEEPTEDPTDEPTEDPTEDPTDDPTDEGTEAL